MIRDLITRMFYEVLKRDYSIYTLDNIPVEYKYQVMGKMFDRQVTKNQVCLVRLLPRQNKLMIAIVPEYKVKSLLNVKLGKAVEMLKASIDKHKYCVVPVRYAR